MTSDFRHTKSYAIMEVTPLVFAEIKQKLIEAGYDHSIEDDGLTLDMHGLALQTTYPHFMLESGAGVEMRSDSPLGTKLAEALCTPPATEDASILVVTPQELDMLRTILSPLTSCTARGLLDRLN